MTDSQTDMPPTDLTEADEARIAALATRQRRANGALMKAVNFVGDQVEDTLKLLPKGARGQIDAAARAALTRSYEVAARTREGRFAGRVNTDAGHKALTAISGALGGFGGLPTALAELPVATTMIFRAVQGVAAQYGEDPADPQVRAQCLAVFGAGGPGTEEGGVDTSFISARLGLTGAAVHGLIARIAPRFGAILTQKLASQAVPIIGAAAGAGTNYAFTDYYVEMAHVHFGLRKLCRELGEDAVLNHFHKVLAGADLPARRQT